MAGVYKLEIKESEAELKQLLRQKTAQGKERVQLLYLLKTAQAKTIQAASQLLCPSSNHASTMATLLPSRGHKKPGGNQSVPRQKKVDSGMGRASLSQAIAGSAGF